MSACPLAADYPPLGQLLLERDSLNRQLHDSTQDLLAATAYLACGGSHPVLGEARLAAVRDVRRGILCRLQAVRLEIAARGPGRPRPAPELN